MSITQYRWRLEELYTLKEAKETLHGLNQQLQQFRTADHAVRVQVKQLEQLMPRVEEMSDVVYCLYAEDVSRPDVIHLLEQTEQVQAGLSAAQTALDEQLRTLSEEEWGTLLEASPSYYLTERRKFLNRRLPAEQEQLIQALGIDGFAAWEQLYEQKLTGLRVPLPEGDVTIGAALHQAMHASTRKQRLVAANGIKEVCAAESDEFAMILNRIAGFRLQVYEKRGWEDPLTELCEQNRTERATIEALLTAIDEQRPVFRDYFMRKLQLANVPDPAWHDLEANRFSPDNRISYPAAQTVILEHFQHIHPPLASFAEHVFDSRWVDAENRPDKAEGGFCASFPAVKESRIFMTYRDVYPDVVTLAHELGHAYHNALLHELPYFEQIKGTSLAETASTFMENLVLDATMETAGPKEKRALLELKIREGMKYVGMIPAMFRFEQRFYEERKQGPVASARINDLMQTEETALYGNLLDEPSPFKWIYVSHFYDTGKAFYNIPYTIGYLLSNHLYAAVKQQNSAFASRVEPFLRASGQASVEELVQEHMADDARSVDFWRRALEPLLEAIAAYIRETDGLFD